MTTLVSALYLPIMTEKAEINALKAISKAVKDIDQLNLVQRKLFDKIEQMNSEARYSIIHALHFPTQTSESSTTE